jgi:hypothetical protein
MISRIVAVLTLLILGPQIADADEWLYCIAPLHAQHKLYMSRVFDTDASLGNAESAFARVLSQSFIRYDDVQCPRSKDESSALVMQQHTISFNREMGNAIINVPWP